MDAASTRRWLRARRHRGIAPWRDIVQAVRRRARRQADPRRRGSTVTGLCRGGMFPAADAAGRARRARRQQTRGRRGAALGARLPGAHRRRPAEGLDGPRRRPRAGHGRASYALLTTPARASMPLAIEPLHPMYAADRACVNTLGACARSVRRARRRPGRRLDVYHVWWDPDLRDRSRAPATASSPITSATGWCRPAIC